MIDESEKKKQAGSVLKQLLTVIENMWNDLDHRRKDFERMDQRTNTCGWSLEGRYLIIFELKLFL